MKNHYFPFIVLKKIIRLCGSFFFAIILMAVPAILLGWTTFIEMGFGTPAAGFLVYKTNWFYGLIGLLGLNVLCSILIRLPLRKKHFPFLLAHLGIIVLIIGCWLTAEKGIEARFTISEGSKQSEAVVSNSWLFNVELTDRLAGEISNSDRSSNDSPNENSGTNPEPTGKQTKSNISKIEKTTASIQIPFSGGPFNWSDYQKNNWKKNIVDTHKGPKILPHLWGIWFLACQNKPAVPKTIYDQNGLKLEILDYLTCADFLPAGPIRLDLKFTGTDKSETVEMAYPSDPQTAEPNTVSWRGLRKKLSGGQRIVYILTESEKEFQGYLNALPQTPEKDQQLEQLVLVCGSDVFRFPVKDLKIPQPLGTTGYKITDFRMTPTLVSELETLQGWTAVVRIENQQGKSEELQLHSEITERNIFSKEFGIAGTLWMQTNTDQSKVRYGRKWDNSLDKSRLELIQSPDGSLAWRCWDGSQRVMSGLFELKEEKDSNVHFTDPVRSAKEAGFEQIKICRFKPNDEPGVHLEPIAFKKDFANEFYAKIRLRATLDGESETFLLRTIPKDSNISAPQIEYFTKKILSKNRIAKIALTNKTVQTGFFLYVRKFRPSYEPGSSTPSSFKSIVDYLPNTENNHLSKKENVVIQMNQPGIFYDPKFGRSWHVYQDSFRGPFLPGSPEFEQAVQGHLLQGEKDPREKIYYTVLSINNDPGRGLKYTGSLMLVLGIALLIYKKRKSNNDWENVNLTEMSFAQNPLSNSPQVKTKTSETESESEKNNSTENEFMKNAKKKKGDHSKSFNSFLFFFCSVLILLLFSSNHNLSAADRRKNDWSSWQSLPVFEEGRIMPLNTFAQLTVKEICGSVHPELRLNPDLLKKLEGGDVLNFPSLDDYCKSEGRQYSEEEKKKLADWYAGARSDALLKQHNAATRIRQIFPNGIRQFDSCELLFSWLAEPDVWDYIPFLVDEQGIMTQFLNGNSDPIQKEPTFLAPALIDQNERYSQLMDSVLSDKEEKYQSKADLKTGDLLKKAAAQLEARYSRYRAVSFNPENNPSPIVRFHLDRILYPAEEGKSESLIGQLDLSVKRAEAFLRLESPSRDKTPFDDKEFLLVQKTKMSGNSGEEREILLIAKILVQLAGSVQEYPLRMNSRLFDRIYGDFLKTYRTLSDHKKDVFLKEKFSVQYRQELLRVCSLTRKLLETLEQASLGLVETGCYEIRVKSDKTRLADFQSADGSKIIRALPPAGLSFVTKGTIRIIPALSELQGSPDEEQTLPWTSFQMLVYGPDEIYRRFVNPNFPQTDSTREKREAGLSSDRPEAAAFKKAAAIWRGLSFNKSYSDAEYFRNFFAALNEFVDSVRNTAEQTRDIRKQMLAHCLGSSANSETVNAVFQKLDYPAKGHLDAEIIYYQLDPFYWMWFLCLLSLVFLIPSGLLGIARGRRDSMTVYPNKGQNEYLNTSLPDRQKNDKECKRNSKYHTDHKSKHSGKRLNNDYNNLQNGSGSENSLLKNSDCPRNENMNKSESLSSNGSPRSFLNNIILESALFYIGLFFLVLSSLITFLGGLIRAWITGWAPVTNMFETVVLLVFLLSCFSIVFVFLPVIKKPFEHAWSLSSLRNINRRSSRFNIGILYAIRLILMILTAYCAVWICYHEYAAGKSIFTALKDSIVRQSYLDRFAVGTTLVLLIWLVPRLLISLLITLISPKKVFVNSSCYDRVRIWERKLWPTIGALSALLIGYWAYTNTTEFNPNIRPLAAVLRSNFWLTIHVFAIIISYALGTLAWCVSIVMLAVYFFGRYRDGSDPEYCEKLEPMLLGLLRSAVLFLTAGTLLGARWADFSWGRFWSWDPKEVWALVTLLIYLVILHGRRARYYGRFGMTIGAVTGAFAIIMTWYGLSFVFGGGGRHAYVSGQSTKTVILCVLVLTNIVLMIPPALVYRIKHRKKKITH